MTGTRKGSKHPVLVGQIQIQELSISERIILAEKLWDSVVDEGVLLELTDKQQFELNSRLQVFVGDQVIVTADFHLRKDSQAWLERT